MSSISSRMDRVFRLEEWAPEQELQPPTHHNQDSPSTSTSMSHRTYDVDSSRRRRQQSLPLSHQRSDFTLSSSFRDLSVEDSEGTSEDNHASRHAGGLRGLWRRASVSFKTRAQRRHSQIFPSDERPATASSPWHKLRQATSFSRHSRLLPPTFDVDGPIDTPHLLSPVPGSGQLPPVIPRGSGQAARATAAAQNEYFGRNRQLALADDQHNDSESGIGIAVTTTTSEPAHYDDSTISRVDFISHLPIELCVQILSHLDHQTLAHALQVSRSWAEVASSQHIWRDAFLREKSRTYAMSRPLQPGTGLGIPSLGPNMDWKDLYRLRQQLEQNWLEGEAKPVYLNGHMDSIYCVQFDESKIITGSRDKTIRVWDMRTYKCTLVIGPPYVTTDDTIMRGTDGSMSHYATMPDHTEQAQCIPQSVSFSTFHNASILCLQYDATILVTGSSDSTCIVYNIASGYQPTMRLRHHTAAVLDLAFDDRYIVTCSKDTTICVWDRATGALSKQLRGHSGPVNAVQMRGNTIVSCSGDFSVKLWNIDTGKNIREFVGHSKGLACSQFSDDSRYIASAGNDKIIRIWDANTGECLKKIAAHDNLVRSLHIDSVSGRLISGSYDQDIKVFEMETGLLLLDFPKWHSSWVLGAKSDYRRIISTGQDPKILIMDFGMEIEGIERLESVMSQASLQGSAKADRFS